MANRTILYLYTEAMGYTMATIKELVAMGCSVHLVYWDHKRLHQFVVKDFPGLKIYGRSNFNYQSLKLLIDSINPELIVVSGWQDKLYVRLSLRSTLQGIKVVTCFDDIWKGGLIQNFAQFLGLFRLFNFFYTYAWVSGPLQFEYAKKLGYKNNEIIFDLLSADVNNFDITKDNYGRENIILFTGRLEDVKGVPQLLEAWKRVSNISHDWKLVLAGNGTHHQYILNLNLPNIEVLGFVQPEKLRELMHRSKAAILPSLREPWGVVIHEFALAGLFIIVSDKVGSGSSFVIHGYNGLIYPSNNIEQLEQSLRTVICSDDEMIKSASNASKSLANKISPVTSARSLMSLLS